MRPYKALTNQIVKNGEYSLVPIRDEDRYDIMAWRNEQMYHLRQSEVLTRQDQDKYFDKVISRLFEEKEPNQILFSYLKSGNCIGYGGLVHINWIDKNAEISFIMNTSLEEENFKANWITYLSLIQKVAFDDLGLHKIHTYAFDLRPRLYEALEKSGFRLEATLKDHCLFQDEFIDVKIHSKIDYRIGMRTVNHDDLELTYNWVNDEAIRRFSYKTGKIPFEDHKKWFASAVSSPDKEYYIFEVNGKAAGSIRFDLEDNGRAKINYLLAPDYFGKGLGTQLLKNGIRFLKEKRPEIKEVFGYVLPENKASVRIFEKLLFEKVMESHSEFKFEKHL